MFILPLWFWDLLEEWQPLKIMLGSFVGDFSGPRIPPGRRGTAEVIPVTVMRSDGMELRSRKLEMNVFWQGWSSTGLAPEGRGRSCAL